MCAFTSSFFETRTEFFSRRLASVVFFEPTNGIHVEYPLKDKFMAQGA